MGTDVGAGNQGHVGWQQVGSIQSATETDFEQHHVRFLALEHQQYYKMSHLEGSARVPLIMAGPGIKEGQVVDTPVSLIDIAPTILDMAGIPVRDLLLRVYMDDRRPVEVFQLPGRKRLSFQLEDGYLCITLPELKDYRLLCFAYK